MANQPTCPKCGALLNADARDGVCPKCHSGRALPESAAGEPGGVEYLGAPGYLIENLAGPGTTDSATVPSAVFDEAPGDRIGHYKLREKIGEGGCGVVYVADQEEPVRRRVALKVIKPGMDTRQVLARFEAERQALAMMDHPNIAKVLDGGTTDTGRPYFVMELVRGIKITDYCDRDKLSTRERLELFIQVCHAVQHAHQKGIIHRDLKPSNILVTLLDGVPVPKVIDFGIAKATEGRLTDLTVYTELHQFIGTAAYMSPEQAEMSGLDIDTRADIYSLGVVLYQLLTGKTPFEHRELMALGLDEMRRTIREKEPLRPSTRLRTLAGEEQTTTAQRRSVEMPKLIHLLRGDVDWIVMKCLEKDRARRFETASGLAMDLQRFLGNEPVVARPPSRLYRFGKLVRRNKLAFAAGTAVIAALVLGLAASLWMFTRERQAHSDAVVAQTETKAALDQARFEEGKAWLERAQSYLEERNPFDAKLMAGRAIGFRGFGREMLTDAQRENFLELLPPGSVEAKEAELILRTADDYALIWHGPVAGDAAGISARSVAFSPDGKLVASGIGSTNIGLWEVATGNLKAILHGHTESVVFVIFSPDGRLLASASYDQTIRLWDVATGTNIASLRGYSTTVQFLAFSPNGGLLAACSVAAAPQLWKVPSGQLLSLQPTESAGGKRQIIPAFSPDSALLALGCNDGSIELWELPAFRKSISWKEDKRRHQRIISGLAFSPDGCFLASGSYDSTVKFWKMPSGEQLKEIQAHASGVWGMQFSPDGGTLASQDTTGIVRFWAVPQGGLKATLRPGTPHVNGGWLSLSPDGGLLATSGFMVRLWELCSGHLEAELSGHSGMVRKVAVDQHGALLASGSDDYTVGLWDLAEGHSRPAFLKHTNAVLAVALSPDGRWAASGGRDGIVRLWSVATRRLEAELPGHREDVRAVAFSPDGTLLASCSRQDGTARLWDVAQRKAWERVPVLTHGGNVRDVAFDPKGRWLATAGSFLMAGTNADANAVKLWDLATRQPKGPPLTPRGFFSSVRFSPDGQYLAAGEYKGTIDLWEVQSGRLKARLLGHSDEVLGLDFSPRGRLLASGSADHTIILWDVESTNLLLKLEGHAGTVSSVVFTPDGRLITGSEDTTIRIWNIEAALRRPLDYASFLNSFDLEGRKVTWKFLGNNPDTPHPGPLPSEGRGRSASDMPMKPFTTNSLISVLQSGLPEEELGRALFNRFLRAGNLSSACLILERHPPQGWTKEAEVLGLAYLREAKHVLDYEGYLLAAQHAARARDCLPAKAAQAWHLSALAERGLKRWPESLAAVEQAIALEPTNAEFWHDKATILEAQDQKPAAREALSRALDLARQADANDPRLETWRQHLELLNR